MSISPKWNRTGIVSRIDDDPPVPVYSHLRVTEDEAERIGYNACRDGLDFLPPQGRESPYSRGWRIAEIEIERENQPEQATLL